MKAVGALHVKMPTAHLCGLECETYLKVITASKYPEFVKQTSWDTRVPMCMCSVAQLCLTLCNSMNCSPPGSSVRGILQAGISE